MKIGTRSVLFGAHQFILHPIFVALAWWRLYGFPADPRLWVAFFVHDLGYCGKPNMDGPEGERHPMLGAAIIGFLFDGDRWTFNGQRHNPRPSHTRRDVAAAFDAEYGDAPDQGLTWFGFCLYHSRYYSKSNGVHFSRLCVADKYSICLVPWWLYLPGAILSGEVAEYMKTAKARYDAGEGGCNPWPIKMSRKEWYLRIQDHSRRWVDLHKDGKADQWTPAPAKEAI